MKSSWSLASPGGSNTWRTLLTPRDLLLALVCRLSGTLVVTHLGLGLVI